MQFSLFGAEAAAPGLSDLDGLLIAGAQWVRTRDRARLSVIVADSWRAAALRTAFAERAVANDDTVVPAESGYAVRTTFSPELAEHAARWTRGANHALPVGFTLSATGLRLWAIATGHREPNGYLLRTRPGDDLLHRTAGAELAGLGVTAVSVANRHRPGWRVSSARRLRRLAELLGPGPADAGDGWPHL